MVLRLFYDEGGVVSGRVRCEFDRYDLCLNGVGEETESSSKTGEKAALSYPYYKARDGS